ncbi:MAG: hypothetical protein LBV79_08200 [Candidatus Adiutrix sp.]|jgi:hypothetical protein|nr:hypothetical protein [Candidatus Adiutrix sp.]
MGTSIWTKAELTAAIAEWKAAYRAASSGRSYTIEGRTLTRYDLDDIRAQLDYLSKELDKASGHGGPFFVQARPRR